MNILIDFTQIPIERTGVGVYADHLLRELLPLLESTDRLIVLAQNDDAGLKDQLSGQVRVTLLTIPAWLFRQRAALLVFEQTVLLWLLFRHQVQVVHSLHYTYPLLASCARAVTIHDSTFTLFPELHTCGRRLLFPFFTRRALKNAECPIFVSESTQGDAERLFGACRHRAHVIPLGVEPGPVMVPDSADGDFVLPAVTPPYLLFVGTLEPRKNIVRIIRAFEEIAAEHPQQKLILAGKLGWHTEEIVSAMEGSPFRKRIMHLGFVTERQKRALLHSCEILVYPSLYEGFGLPVLEAMAQGAPVITSSVSSLPEVAGDAAILVDPSATCEIATAIDRLLRDDALRATLKKAGLARAAELTWRRTATSTYAAYLETVTRQL